MSSSREAIEAARGVVAQDMVEMTERLSEARDAMAGTKVLLTGGAGFLGYYFVQLFAHWNRSRPETALELTVADNYLRGVPRWLAELDGHDGVVCLRHDVTQPLPAELGSFDYVLHAASVASPTYYRKHPLETMDANVQGLRLLLDRAVEQAEAGHPTRAFLVFSTSEIYGDPPAEWIPTPETYRGNVSCTGPRACYDESKRFSETLAVTFADHYGVPVRVVRPFNNYGPGLRLDDRRVLPDFARDVLEGRDIVMHSDGTPTRTFCYIADAVVGYLRALTRGGDGEPYNIGAAGPEISMADLAEAVVELGRSSLGYEGRIVKRVSEEAAYLVDNPSRRRPDVRKASRELGYEAVVGLNEGLRRTMIWYRGALAESGQGA